MPRPASRDRRSDYRCARWFRSLPSVKLAGAMVLGLTLAGCAPEDGEPVADAAWDARTDPADAAAFDAFTPSGPLQPDSGPRPDAGTESGTDAGGDSAVPSVRVVRFVVLGDGGTGDEAQRKVSLAIRDVCARRGCDFALYLGDNIYNTGAASADDPQFVSKFEEPYAELDFPFYVALGNHDYGNDGINLFPEDRRSAAQVEYTTRSRKWTMPDYFYSARVGPVELFALDTNAIVIDQFRRPQQQKAWLDAALAASDARWKIVFGHHPYLSNGNHGIAGNYQGPIGVELHDGSTFKAFVEQAVCGKAQVYFSGHDHHREWLEPTCGTTFIVSGAAAKLHDRDDRGAASRWSSFDKRGFLWVEVKGDTLTGVFYDEDGASNYEELLQR